MKCETNGNKGYALSLTNGAYWCYSSSGGEYSYSTKPVISTSTGHTFKNSNKNISVRLVGYFYRKSTTSNLYATYFLKAYSDSDTEFQIKVHAKDSSGNKTRTLNKAQNGAEKEGVATDFLTNGQDTVYTCYGANNASFIYPKELQETAEANTKDGTGWFNFQYIPEGTETNDLWEKNIIYVSVPGYDSGIVELSCEVLLPLNRGVHFKVGDTTTVTQTWGFGDVVPKDWFGEAPTMTGCTFTDWKTENGLTFTKFRDRTTNWFKANKYSSFETGVNLYKSYLKDLPQGTIVFLDEGQYKANEGTLKFDSNKKGLIRDLDTEGSQTAGGVSSLSKSAITGVAINLNRITVTPTESNKYDFVGWSKTANGSTISSSYTPVVTTLGATVDTLYAIYKTKTCRFTVTISKDEITNKTVTVDAGTTISAALKKILGKDFDSTLPGQTFVGFREGNPKTGPLYSLDSQIFADLNVTAEWAPREYSVRFYTAANNTDGNFEEVPVTEGTEIPEDKYPDSKLPFPNTDGLAFSGWYTDKALTSPFDKTTKITANLSLYSKWEKIVYINFYNQTESLGRFQWGGVGQNFALPENGIISLTKKSPCDITGLTALENLSTEDSNARLKENKANYGLENVDDLSNYGLYGKITLNGGSPWVKKVNQKRVSVSSISTGSSGEYTLYVNWQPEYVYRTETSSSDGTQKAYLIKYLGKETSVTIPTQVRGTGDKKNEEIDVAGFDCVTKVETETDGEGNEVVKTTYISNLVGEFTVTSDGTVVNTLTTLTKITVPAIKNFDLRTNSLIGWSDKHREDKPILNFEGGDIKVNDGFTDGYIKFYGRHSESINSYCNEHKDIGLSQWHTLQFVIVSEDGTPLDTQKTVPFECGTYSTMVPVPSFENYQPAEDRWYPSREALASGKNRVNFENKSSKNDPPSPIEDDGTYYAYVYSMNFLLDLEGLQHLSEVCDERYSIKAGTSPSLPENKQLSLLSLPDDFTDRGVTLSKTNTTPVVKIDTTNFDYNEGSLSLSALDKDTDENKPGLVSKSYISSYINQVSGKVKEINGSSNGIIATPENDGSKYTISLDYSAMKKATDEQLGVCGIQPNGGLNSTNGFLTLLSATKDNLGGVKVPADQELQIDSSGNLTVSQAFYTNRLRGSSYFDIRNHQYTDDTSSLGWYGLGDYTCWSKQRIARSVGGNNSTQLDCYDLYTEGFSSTDGAFVITGIDNNKISSVALSSCLQTKPKTCTVVRTNSKSSATVGGGKTALYGFCQPGFTELKPGDYYLFSVFVHTDAEVKVSLGCAYMDNSTQKIKENNEVEKSGKTLGYSQAVTITNRDVKTKDGETTYWTRVVAYGNLPDNYLTQQGYSNILTDAKIGYCYVTPTKTGQEATVKFLAPSLMRIPKSAIHSDWSDKDSLQLGYEISTNHDYRFNWRPAPEDYLHLPEDRDIRNMLSKKVSIVDSSRAGDSGYIYLPGNRIMIWGGLQPPVKGTTDSWLSLVDDKTHKNFGTGTLDSDVGQVGIKRKIFNKPLANLQVFVTHQGAGNLGTLDQTAFRKQTYVATQTQQYVGEAEDTWVDFIVYLGGTDKSYYDQFCQWGRFANYFCIASVVGTIE